MSSAESRLDFLDSIICSSKDCVIVSFFCIRHRRKTSTLCFLYKIYHRVDHPMNEYLDRFVATRNTRASTVLGELALVI